MEMNPIGKIVAGKIQLEIVRLQRSGSPSSWSSRLRSTVVTNGTITPVHRMSRCFFLFFSPLKDQESRILCKYLRLLEPFFKWGKRKRAFLSSRQKYLWRNKMKIYLLPYPLSWTRQWLWNWTHSRNTCFWSTWSWHTGPESIEGESNSFSWQLE